MLPLLKTSMRTAAGADPCSIQRFPLTSCSHTIENGIHRQTAHPPAGDDTLMGTVYLEARGVVLWPRVQLGFANRGQRLTNASFLSSSSVLLGIEVNNARRSLPLGKERKHGKSLATSTFTPPT